MRTHRTGSPEKIKRPKEKRPTFRPGALPNVPADATYAVRTVDGSTFTPGPIVEVTAMRWM